jgi:hypothetical protein
LCTAAVEVDGVISNNVVAAGESRGGAKDSGNSYCSCVNQCDAVRASRAADRQVVEIERWNGLRTGAVEVNGAARDGMTNCSAGREHPGDTNCAGGRQHLGEVTEGQITVIERPHILAV